MSDAPRSVLVVDLSSLFWTTALGMRASAAATDMVLRKIRGLAAEYDRVAIACDARGEPFRRAIWPGYKAKDNPERTPERWEALGLLERQCFETGYHCFRAVEHPDYEGYYYESDDVIATIVSWCVRFGARVDIATGDSDIAQLVDDEAGVAMLRCWNGEVTRLDAAAVEAWKHVSPPRILELKALAGDGDGYKPFPGIGEKHAVSLLAQAPHPTAISVVEAAIVAGVVYNQDGKTENKIAKTLREGGIARVEFGYQMARMCNDASGVAADSLVLPRMPVKKRPEPQPQPRPEPRVDPDAEPESAGPWYDIRTTGDEAPPSAWKGPPSGTRWRGPWTPFSVLILDGERVFYWRRLYEVRT